MLQATKIDVHCTSLNTRDSRRILSPAEPSLTHSHPSIDLHDKQIHIHVPLYTTVSFGITVILVWYLVHVNVHMYMLYYMYMYMYSEG